MHPLVQRPSAHSRDGFLLKSHFQVAYVTNDIARACDILTERYGIRKFRRSEGDMPNGDGHMHTALAWAGETMYEVIQAEGEKLAFYNHRLSPTEFQIRHHHFGYLVQDQAEWDAIMAQVARANWTITYESGIPGFMLATYVEAPELGHYLEFVLPQSAEGAAYLQDVPVN